MLPFQVASQPLRLGVLACLLPGQGFAVPPSEKPATHAAHACCVPVQELARLVSSLPTHPDAVASSDEPRPLAVPVSVKHVAPNVAACFRAAQLAVLLG
ncbi:hypothetical protein JG687_00014893 [Phytophthora cactorum]|uniref:Secreted protein n=1 Tax=Phytophthora cactorum TaxID=29920 RepID=A0A8T1TYG0_9STRA|nr:hypothetical protein JG687_00014893 [Phytophthora cactorum]